MKKMLVMIFVIILNSNVHGITTIDHIRIFNENPSPEAVASIVKGVSLARNWMLDFTGRDFSNEDVFIVMSEIDENTFGYFNGTFIFVENYSKKIEMCGVPVNYEIGIAHEVIHFYLYFIFGCDFILNGVAGHEYFAWNATIDLSKKLKTHFNNLKPFSSGSNIELLSGFLYFMAPESFVSLIYNDRKNNGDNIMNKILSNDFFPFDAFFVGMSIIGRK